MISTDKRRGIINICMYLGMVLVLAVVAVIIGHITKPKKHYDAKADGVVISSTLKDSGIKSYTRGARTHYNVQVSFEVDGVEKIATVEMEEDLYDGGEQVTVEYNPNNPKECIIEQ